jgi:hypothetical protein
MIFQVLQFPVIALFINFTVLLIAQNRPAIIDNKTDGKLSFYDAKGKLIKEIYYNSNETAINELRDSGEYNTEFDDSGMRYQSAAVINNEIAVLQDHVESYVLPVVELTQVYNQRGEVIYEYDGDLSISFSPAASRSLMAAYSTYTHNVSWFASSATPLRVKRSLKVTNS